jgi:hypothetical protein
MWGGRSHAPSTIKCRRGVQVAVVSVRLSAFSLALAINGELTVAAGEASGHCQVGPCAVAKKDPRDVRVASGATHSERIFSQEWVVPDTRCRLGVPVGRVLAVQVSVRTETNSFDLIGRSAGGALKFLPPG